MFWGQKQGALWFQPCPGESRPTGRPGTAGNQGYFLLAFCSAMAASTTLATQTSQDQGPTGQEATRPLSCCWALTGRLLVTGGLPHGWPLRLQKHYELMRQVWADNPRQQRVAKNLLFTPIRMTIIPKKTNHRNRQTNKKTQKIQNGGKNVEKMEPF